MRICCCYNKQGGSRGTEEDRDRRDRQAMHSSTTRALQVTAAGGRGMRGTPGEQGILGTGLEYGGKILHDFRTGRAVRF